MANIGFTPSFGGGNMPPATNLAGVYQNALGRAPDAEGLAFYQGQMNNGRTFGQLRENIWQSPEAQQFAQTQNQPQNPNVFDTSGGAFNDAVNMAGNTPQVTPAAISAPQVSAPQQITTSPVQAERIQAGQLSNTDLNSYMNPFTKAVTDNTMGDLERQRQIALNNTNSAAAGAFGGSRHGVMQGETNRGFADAVASTSAGLNQANFGNAQAAAFQDIGNRFAGDQSNQNAFLNASNANASNSLSANTSNASNQLQAGMANASNAFNASRSNQAAGMQAGMANASNNLQASNQLGSLSNLGFTLGNNALGAQANAGGQQQDLMQQLMNNARGQTMGQTGDADMQLQRLLGSIDGVPQPVSTQESSNPGIVGLLSAFL